MKRGPVSSQREKALLARRVAELEAELSECQDSIRTTFELSRVGQTHGDPVTQRFLRVNRAFCRILGYSEAELLQRTFRDISHPDDRDIFTDAYPRLLSGELAEYVTDKRYIHKDGHIVWVSINASLLPAKPGEPPRAIAIIQDITSRKNAEAAALESATKLLAIFEHSVDAIAVYKGLNHAMVNPAYLRLFGYASATELIGTPGPDLIAPSERESIHRNIQRRMRGQPVASNYITRGLRKDGTEFDLEIHASQFDLHGERFRLVILRDVTERLEAERERRTAHARLERRVRERTIELTQANTRLKRESKKRERLEAELREVAERERQRIGQDLHDGLGQQLAGISYMASASARAAAHGKSVSLAKLQEIAALLTEAVRHTQEISHGLYPVELEEEGLVFALRRLAEHIARSCKIDCTFHGAEDFLWIKKDTAMQLYRIAQEATANAIKHGHPGRIRICLRASTTTGKKTLELCVEDDGDGFVAPVSTKANTGPRGMGLTTMKNRARLLGGDFSIRKNAGGGVTVTCVIPCAHGSGGAAPVLLPSS